MSVITKREVIVSSIDMKKLFSDTKTVAVVGLSNNPGRTSHRIGKYLKNEAKYSVIPINPNVSEVFGEKSYDSLLDIPVDIEIDIVNIFRRSEYLPEIARQAVKRNCKFFWAQLGVYNEEAEQILQDAGIPYIMNQCIFVEHQSVLH